MASKPTIVLIHGALTDASIWNAITARLQRDGYATLAPAMPLRGLASDAEYLSAFLIPLPSHLYLLGTPMVGLSFLTH